MNNKIFLFVFICLMLATVVSAAERPLEIDYPELGGYEPTTVQQTLLPDYIKYLFNFSLIIVGLIVFAALIIGGFLYLISSGDPAKLGDAKDRIFGALTGMVLLLSSWLILNTINPQLTIFYPIGLEEVSIYQGQPGTVTLFAETNCETIKMYPKCDDENPCAVEETECFDIFKTGEKRCVLKDKIINLSKQEDLEKLPLGESDNWGNKAWSIIYYGDNYKIRVCDNSEFENCEIITKPNTCRDASFAISSIEVMTKVNGARLYKEANFGGEDYQDFPFDENNICYTDLSYIGDSQASSIEVDTGYWTVLCKEKNGDCGYGPKSIIYETFSENMDGSNDTTGTGDPDLSNNYVNNSVSKICVIKSYTCGGVLAYGDGRSDFIEKKGEKTILGSENTILNNNAIERIYQYGAYCKVKICEKAGTGNQGDVLNSEETCSGPGICCGREWTSQLFNGEIILDHKEPDIPGWENIKYSCFNENDCMTTNCKENKYTFCSNDPNCSDCSENYCCPEYSQKNDLQSDPPTIYYPEYCPDVKTEVSEVLNYCNSCSRCNEINSIYKKASCIQVLD